MLTVVLGYGSATPRSRVSRCCSATRCSSRRCSSSSASSTASSRRATSASSPASGARRRRSRRLDHRDRVDGGLAPTVGFVAKEAVLTSLLDGGTRPDALIPLIGIVLGSMLTTAYGLRFVWGAFWTKKDASGAPAPHRGPIRRWVPRGADPAGRADGRRGFTARCSTRVLGLRRHAPAADGYRTTSRSGTGGSRRCSSRWAASRWALVFLAQRRACRIACRSPPPTSTTWCSA
jgi:hypothetical protein